MSAIFNQPGEAMQEKNKGLILILDGVGDRPSAALGGATPLEAACTPNLDDLVSRGQCGQIDPLIPGFPVGTHTGTGTLLGMPITDACRLQRGPVEAAGVGIEVAPGDVVLRCNLAHLRREGGQMRILDRRAGRVEADTAALCAALNDLDIGADIRVRLHAARQHRAVLHLSGPGLAPSVSDTDPGEGVEEQFVAHCHGLAVGDSVSVRTADAINRFVDLAHTLLDRHPLNQQRAAAGKCVANGVITRGAGSLIEIRHLLGHLGLRVAMVAGGSTVSGLARLMNFTVINQPSFTATPGTDYAGKVAAAQAALLDHDLVFLHIKAPDICAHDRDPVAKKEVFETVDAALAPLLDPALVVGVSGDHSTDSNLGRHTGEPVPSLLYMPGGRRDACSAYGESDCMRGGLGRIGAVSFLICVLDAMGRLSNYRAGDHFFGDL